MWWNSFSLNKIKFKVRNHQVNLTKIKYYFKPKSVKISNTIIVIDSVEYHLTQDFSLIHHNKKPINWMIYIPQTCYEKTSTATNSVSGAH